MYEVHYNNKPAIKFKDIEAAWAFIESFVAYDYINIEGFYIVKED